MSRLLSGLPADQSYSYVALERIARSVRGKLGYDPGAAIDASALFDDLIDYKVAIQSKPVPITTGVAGISSEGLTWYDPEHDRMEILVSDDTYYGLIAGKPRAAYCFSHEIGHALLHAGQLYRISQLEEPAAAFQRGVAKHAAYMDTEWQANAFASALLMPAHGLAALERELGDLQAEDIARRFGTSLEAATYRLELFAERRTRLTLA